MTDQIDKMMEQLPPELQREVREFARSLLERKRRAGRLPRRKHLRMKWAGALREFRGQFSSIELQRKATEWWGD